MTMKKFLLIAFAMVFSMSIFAQGPQRGKHREFNPEKMATHQADRLKKELDLNEKQYQSVYDLYLKRAEEMKALFANRQEGQKPNHEARREEMKKQQEALEASLKEILTKKQFAKYQEMQKKKLEQRKQGGPRGHHPHGGPRGGQGMPPRQ